MPDLLTYPGGVFFKSLFIIRTTSQENHSYSRIPWEFDRTSLKLMKSHRISGLKSTLGPLMLESDLIRFRNPTPVYHTRVLMIPIAYSFVIKKISVVFEVFPFEHKTERNE